MKQNIKSLKCYSKKIQIIILTILLLAMWIFSFLSKNSFKNDASAEELSKEQAEKIILSTPIYDRKNISKDLWLKSEILDNLSYKVLWKHGTERPFTSELNEEKREWVFVTKGCNIPVFSSEDKFDSGTGWPSFTHTINEDNIILKNDYLFGIKRIEVLSKCGEHLGHVFNDWPKDKWWKRWCINGAALNFVPKEG